MSEKNEKNVPDKHQPGDGIRSMKTSRVFRVVNFELYAKPVSTPHQYTPLHNNVHSKQTRLYSKAFHTTVINSSIKIAINYIFKVYLCNKMLLRVELIWVIVLCIDLFQNMVVMAIGLTAFIGCSAYIAYMRSEWADRGYYSTYTADGEETFKKRKSRWD